MVPDSHKLRFCGLGFGIYLGSACIQKGQDGLVTVYEVQNHVEAYLILKVKFLDV
jgi:hypothetical protein